MSPLQEITSPSSIESTILCFTGDRNAPNKKADFTGAFLPECKAFMKYHNIPAGNHLRVNLGLSEAKRYDSLKTFIASKGHGPTSLVFFCHGF